MKAIAVSLAVLVAIVAGCASGSARNVSSQDSVDIRLAVVIHWAEAKAPSSVIYIDDDLIEAIRSKGLSVNGHTFRPASKAPAVQPENDDRFYRLQFEPIEATDSGMNAWVDVLVNGRFLLTKKYLLKHHRGRWVVVKEETVMIA